MSLDLYQICSELKNLFLNIEVDENTGEVLPGLEQKLNQIIMEKEGKALNIARLIKNLNSESVAIKNEVESLTARRKRIENKIEWLKQYLSTNISGEKYRDSCVEIGWRKSTSVVITDETKIPVSLCRHIPEKFEPDKMAIKSSICNGNIVEGAALEEKLNLQIK